MKLKACFHRFRLQAIGRVVGVTPFVVVLMEMNLGHAAEIKMGLSSWDLTLQNVTLYAGDSFTWTNAFYGGVVTESYSGEWRATLAESNSTFTYQFNRPGVWYYKYYDSNPQLASPKPASVTVLV